ncbi:MAG: hypothetical protein KAS04_04760, partial [Candidatus Aenigmarchaeota archaeon]|nr:hypothetical protein [Candidatus Aenigmarchaeota archaeon]
KLQNGTNQYVSKNEILNHADFHDFDFTSINISYTAGTAATNYRTPATSGTWIVSCPAEASNPYSICMVNATIPSRIPGGRYNVRGGVTLNTSIIGGTGINISSDLTTSGTEVVINDAGLYIINKNHIWVNEAQYLDEGQYAIYVVYVKNYGPLVANNFMITLNNPSSCEVDIAPYVANTSCMGTAQSNSSGDTWTITTIPAYMGETNCTVAWKVTANTVTVDQSACYLNVGIDSSTQHGNYGNLTNIGVEVHDNSSTTSDPGTSSAPSTESGCTSDSDCAESQACVSGTCSAISCPSGYVKDHTCYSYENEFLISDYTETIEIVQGGSNSTKVTIKNNGAYTRVAKLNATSSVSGATTEVTPTSYNLATGNSGIFTVNLTSVEDIEVGYHKLTLKVYVSTNTSIYKTKEINLVVSPREETKVMINQTYDQLKLLFASVASLFNQIPPSTDGNYTIANRTYTRILNMLSEAKDKLNAGQYVDAYSILKETNTSISEFKNQISDMSESPIFEFGGTLGLVAIIVVIIVIGGFLVYLLMPPKKGYHPVFGYRPKKKFALPKKGGALGSIKDRFKNVKIGKKKQHTLGDYNGPMPFQKKKPSLLPRPPEPEKRSILEGYKSEEKFPYSFDKSGMKDKKKKFFGK